MSSLGSDFGLTVRLGDAPWRMGRDDGFWIDGGRALRERRTAPAAVRLPADIERRAEAIEPASRLCPCGCGELTRIGGGRSERLDIVPKGIVTEEERDEANETEKVWTDRAFLAIATAKIRGGQAAGAGAGIAHQVHGAMGFTREYSLQHRTRRLWAWRDEFDPETTWAIDLGRHVAVSGGDALWATVTAV